MKTPLALAGCVATLALAAPSALGQTNPGSLQRCASIGTASVVEQLRASCPEAQSLATALLAAPVSDTAAVVEAAGWTPLRARDVAGAPPSHDLLVLRGTAAVRLRLPGDAPDLDGFAAGRELVFSGHRIVGGQRIPRDGALCTSSFLVTLPNGRRGGLSAAHCAGLHRDRSLARHNVAERRPPAPGIVLGRVLKTVLRTDPLDALVLPVPSGPTRPASQVVDRGLSRAPWTVAGTAAPEPGRVVCFSGRTSGLDHCGRIVGRQFLGAERLLSVRAGVLVRCTDIRARQGDSGGPVYTYPNGTGTVKAVGLVELIVGRGAMCFTPIRPVLRSLHATLVASA